MTVDALNIKPNRTATFTRNIEPAAIDTTTIPLNRAARYLNRPYNETITTLTRAGVPITQRGTTRTYRSVRADQLLIATFRDPTIVRTPTTTTR